MTSGNGQSVGLHLMVPGVNIPLTELPLFLAVLFISLSIHEFGHMLAARNDDITVLDCGLFVFFSCIGMFVTVDTSSPGLFSFVCSHANI